MKRYLKAHRVSARWTTFNGALQSALSIPEDYDANRHADALALLGQRPDADLVCVYCGDPARTWDHLENTVREGRFSGFGHRLLNLVPACRTCNEEKGSKPWRTYLTKLAREDRARRERAIARFAAANAAERFGWAYIETELPELAKQYDKVIREIRAKLAKADAIAARIRDAVAERNGLPIRKPRMKRKKSAPTSKRVR